MTEVPAVTSSILLRLEGSLQPASVEDLIAAEEASVIVDASDHRRACHHCGRALVLRMWTTHRDMGPVAVLRVCRYMNHVAGGMLIQEKSFRPITWTNTFSVGGEEYTVQSLIVHRGPSPHSGHYVCWVKYAEQWLEFDDEVVRCHAGVPKEELKMLSSSWVRRLSRQPRQGLPRRPARMHRMTCRTRLRRRTLPMRGLGLAMCRRSRA